MTTSTTHPPADPATSPPDHAALLRDLATIATIRAFEERLKELAAQEQVPGAVHLAAGHEAVAVGVCSLLDDRDYISSTHRGHGHALAKGCDPVALFEEVLGRAGGVCGGYGGSMHVADFERGMLGANGIAGGGVPMACGAALTAKYLGTGGVAVAFLGDGAVNQGAVSESLTLAAVWNLPVVFVVEDNGYAQATGTPFHLQGIPVRQRGEAHGVPSRTVDGSDYFAVREAASWAIGHARGGAGPALLECHVARLFGHMEGFDRQAYRGAGEIEREWRERDPLATFTRIATEDGLLEPDEIATTVERSWLEIAAASERALQAPYPSAAAMTRHVYATPIDATATKESTS